MKEADCACKEHQALILYYFFLARHTERIWPSDLKNSPGYLKTAVNCVHKMRSGYNDDEVPSPYGPRDLSPVPGAVADIVDGPQHQAAPQAHADGGHEGAQGSVTGAPEVHDPTQIVEVNNLSDRMRDVPMTPFMLHHNSQSTRKRKAPAEVTGLESALKMGEAMEKTAKLQKVFLEAAAKMAKQYEEQKQMMSSFLNAQKPEDWMKLFIPGNSEDGAKP